MSWPKRRHAMKTKILAGAALIAAVGAVQAADKNEVPLSTPPGVTLVDVLNPSDEFLWRRLGDAGGAALYTFDKDVTGKASCIEDCAKEFPPFTASAGAQGSGDWSLIDRGHDM